MGGLSFSFLSFLVTFSPLIRQFEIKSFQNMKRTHSSLESSLFLLFFGQGNFLASQTSNYRISLQTRREEELFGFHLLQQMKLDQEQREELKHQGGFDDS